MDNIPLWFAIPAVPILWLSYFVIRLRQNKKIRDMETKIRKLDTYAPKVYFKGRWNSPLDERTP